MGQKWKQTEKMKVSSICSFSNDDFNRHPQVGSESIGLFGTVGSNTDFRPGGCWSDPRLCQYSF